MEENVINVIFRSKEEAKQKTEIKCKPDESMENILMKVENNFDPKDFEFYYKDKIIDKKLTIINLTNNKIVKNIEIFIKRKSKIMKCSQCEGNNSIIKFENYRLHFYKCCYDHEGFELISNYQTTQNLKYNSFSCVDCNQLPENYYFKQFYKCLTCTKVVGNTQLFCSKHLVEHKDHKAVKYEEKSYYCLQHFNQFVSYCIDCKKNLCDQCIKEHKEKKHKVKSFKKMIEKLKTQEIQKEFIQIKEKTVTLKKCANEIKKMIDDAVKIIDQYLDIAKDLIEKYNSYNSTLKNYQVLRTIHYLEDSNKKIMDDLSIIKTGEKTNEEWKNICCKLIEIYKSDRGNYVKGNKMSKTESNLENSISFDNEDEKEESINENEDTKSIKNDNHKKETETKKKNLTKKKSISNKKKYK